jgi:hypothetical protein
MVVNGVTTNEGRGLLIGFWAVASDVGINATAVASKIIPCPPQPLALVRMGNIPANR